MTNNYLVCKSCNKDFKNLNDRFKKMYVISKCLIHFNDIKGLYIADTFPNYSPDSVSQFYCEPCFQHLAGKEFM